MKRILLIPVLLLSGFLLKAQENLAPDQNPNYKQSLAKYVAMRDSGVAHMNTTVQQTYKAFDWYEAKLERRQQRFEFRQQRRMARIMNRNNGFCNSGWNNWGPYGFSPYNSFRNNWGWWGW